MIIFKDIQIKALKVLVILTYCFINISGKNEEGHLITFLFMELINNGSSFFYSIIAMLSLTGMLFTVFKPNPKRDKILIPVISVSLLVPLLLAFNQTFTHLNWSNHNRFITTLIVFILLDVLLIIQTLKQKKITR